MAPLIPSFSLGISKQFPHKEQKEVQNQSTGGNDGIAQEGKGGEGGVEQEHGIDRIGTFRRCQRFKHGIAIDADAVHHQNGQGDVGHVLDQIHFNVAKGENQQDVKQQGGVGKDALGHFPIPEGGVENEIHIGKHTNQGGENAKPEQIIRPKGSHSGCFVFQKTIQQGAPHHHIAGVDGQKQIGIVPEVFHGGAAGQTPV